MERYYIYTFKVNRYPYYYAHFTTYGREKDAKKEARAYIMERDNLRPSDLEYVGREPRILR